MTTHDSDRDRDREEYVGYLRDRVTAAEEQVRHHTSAILRAMQDTFARLDGGGTMGLLQGKGDTLDTWCAVLNERREALDTATRFLATITA